jgi:hypothetical protein
MSAKRVTEHLCCCSAQLDRFQATLLLCLEHSFMPSRLKDWTIGPPSVHDAMAPTPCFLPPAAVVCTPSMFHCTPCRCAFVFARRVLQCQTVLQFPPLVCCLLEDDSLNCTSKQTHCTQQKKRRCGSGGVVVEAHVKTPKTVFLDLAPMRAVPVVLLRYAQLHLYSTCD